MNTHNIHIRLTVLIGMLLVPVLVACGGTPPSDQANSPASTTSANAAVSGPATTAPMPSEAAPLSTMEAVPATPPDAGGATTVSGTPSSGKVLRVHQLGYPDTMDPQKLSYTNEIVATGINYEGLTRLDKELTSVPAAAERWAFNTAGDEITFTIRDGLTYSDGSPLTAENFRYAIQRTCDPKTAGQYQAILFDIAGCADFASTPVTDTAKYDAAKASLGVTVPDERTLHIRLTHPAPYFPYIAGLWVMFPVKQELIEAAGDDWWRHAENFVGNGPFQITEIHEDQMIVSRANERYWGGRPKLDAIEYVYQADPSVALSAYKAGQLDIVRPDPADLPAVQSDAELSKQLVRYAQASTFQLQFNLSKAPFDDPKVREAFAYAFDRATYCDQILSGTCVPTLTWIPGGVPGHIETDKFSFDPEQAKAALAASRYGGAAGLPEVKFTYNSSNPSEQPRAEWIAGQYRDVLGVEITLDPVDLKTIISLSKSHDTYPQMSVGGWVQDYPDPQNWLSVYWQSQAMFAQNLGYKNEKLDELLAQADVELDATKRIALYEQVGRILVDDQPGVFVANTAGVMLVKPEVTGYQPTPSDFEWPGQWVSLLTVDVQR